MRCLIFVPYAWCDDDKEEMCLEQVGGTKMIDLVCF